MQIRLKQLITIVICCNMLLIFQPLTAQKTNFEKIKAQCEGIAHKDRIRMTVTRFSATANAARGRFGDELATMLSSAMQQVNCFRMLESTKNMSDMTDEIGIGQQGYTNAATSPQSGKMLGAQVVVTGEITEYNEGNVGVSGPLLRVGMNKASIGFILKIVDPETREILWTKSVNTSSVMPGSFSGTSLLGLPIAGGSFRNAAIGDAVEKAILKAVELIVKEREDIPLPDAGKGLAKPKSYNRSNCKYLQGGTSPKVMVVIPETHLASRIPDPAGETEIIRKFIEAGFRVIDKGIYEKILKNQKRLEEAEEDASKAASLGAEFGADIIIIGEAFSQRTGVKDGMISCRARVEAKVVLTKDATILAAHGLDAGAIDVSEAVGAKKALREAGSVTADYFLQQLCDDGTGGQDTKSAGATASSKPITITVQQASFESLKDLSDILKANKKVESVEKTLDGKEGTLKIKHSASLDELMEELMLKSSKKFEVKNMNGSTATIRMK